jgi:hypothetical protein
VAAKILPAYAQSQTSRQTGGAAGATGATGATGTTPTSGTVSQPKAAPGSGPRVVVDSELHPRFKKPVTPGSDEVVDTFVSFQPEQIQKELETTYKYDLDVPQPTP